MSIIYSNSFKQYAHKHGARYKSTFVSKNVVDENREFLLNVVDENRELKQTDAAAKRRRSHSNLHSIEE